MDPEPDIVSPPGGFSRAELLGKIALGAGAIYALQMAGFRAARALAIVGENDADSLNFLLPFEYLQVDFYEGARQRLKTSKETMEMIELIAEEEKQHVATLTAAVKQFGGEPTEKGSYAFAYRDEAGFLRIAGELEQSAFGAYNGVIPKLESAEAIELMGSLAQVEGRHAAALRAQMGETPVPTAFDQAYTPLEALNSVLKFAGQAIYQETG